MFQPGFVVSERQCDDCTGDRIQLVQIQIFIDILAARKPSNLNEQKVVKTTNNTHSKSKSPFTQYSRLSNRLLNRLDNRLYRVNGV